MPYCLEKQIRRLDCRIQHAVLGRRFDTLYPTGGYGVSVLLWIWHLQYAKKGVIFIDFTPVLQLCLQPFKYDTMRDTKVKGMIDTLSITVVFDTKDYCSVTGPLGVGAPLLNGSSSVQAGGLPFNGISAIPVPGFSPNGVTDCFRAYWDTKRVSFTEEYV
ncbi:hypothetical protein Tco_1328632 [Tanacetum coccineum]